MRQILLIALLLLIVDALPLRQRREGKLNEEGTGKQPSNPRGNNLASTGKTGSLGSRREDGENPVPNKNPEFQGKRAGMVGRTGTTHIDGKPPKSQSNVSAANVDGKNPQSVEGGAKDNQKRPKPVKDPKEPTEKNPNPGGDGEKSKMKTSRSDVDSSVETKGVKTKDDEAAGPGLKASNNGEGKQDKLDNQKLTENKGGDEDDDGDRGVKDPKSDAVVPPKDDNKEADWDGTYDEEIQSKPEEKAFGQVSVKTIGKVGSPSEASSSSSFVTYFIIAAVIVIVIYLLFHNKKKLMAYVIEGRNTGRVRRGRGASGAEYKPLNNPEESTGCRTESA